MGYCSAVDENLLVLKVVSMYIHIPHILISNYVC